MKLNRHIIAGRVVEADHGSLPSGAVTSKLRVMTDDGWYDTKKKEYQKRNTYHTVKAIGKVAESMITLQKDDWCLVEGSRLTDSWEDRDGNKKYADYLRPSFVVEIENPWEDREPKPKSQDKSSPYPTAQDDIPF